MRQIPQRIRKIIAKSLYYKKCARKADGNCSGRITIEHAFIYAGQQINELWSLIPLCWYHHLGAGLNKRSNELIALERATDEDLEKYPKVDWKQKKKYLQSLFKSNEST